MINRYLFFCLFLVLGICNTSAQLSISFLLGYSTSAHNDLKELQKNVASLAPIYTQEANNFNPSSHWEVNLSNTFNRNIFGLYYLAKETGGRIGSQDKTGFYRFDQLVNYRVFGISYQRAVDRHLSFGLRIGFSKTTNNISEELVAYDYTLLEESLVFHGTGVEINPLLTFRVRPEKNIQGFIQLGYLHDFSKNLSLDDQESQFKPDWSGLRVGAGIEINFVKILTGDAN